MIDDGKLPKKVSGVDDVETHLVAVGEVVNNLQLAAEHDGQMIQRLAFHDHGCPFGELYKARGGHGLL